jgi:hypothetical protein
MDSNNYGYFFFMGGMSGGAKQYRAEIDSEDGPIMLRTATPVASYMYLWENLNTAPKRDLATRVRLYHEPSKTYMLNIDRTKSCEHTGEQAFHEWLDSLEEEIFIYYGGDVNDAQQGRGIGGPGDLNI